MKKKCQKCKRLLSKTCYFKNNAKVDKLGTECKECRRKYMSKYYRANKPTLDEYNKNRNKRRHTEAKFKVLYHYSNGSMRCMCVGCDVSFIEFLSIEHVNGNGNEDRKNFKGARTYYEYLVKQGYPEGLTVFCYNCNLSKGFFGYCPHSQPLTTTT